MSIVSKVLELFEHRGAASGYASLDANSLVAQKPADRLGLANLAWTADKLLKGAGAGADPTEIDVPAGPTLALQANDTLRNSNDTERTVAAGGAGATYTKIKEVLLNADLAACRIKFDLKTTGNQTAYGKIYKDGVAIGAEQSCLSSSYATKTEDFTSFVSGDLIQIYAKDTGTAGGGAFVRNMRFYYSKYVTAFGGDTLDTSLLTTTDPTISMTNQDQ